LFISFSSLFNACAHTTKYMALICGTNKNERIDERTHVSTVFFKGLAMLASKKF